MEQKNIIDSVCRKICSIVKEGEKWVFKDCKGSNFEWPDNGNRFPGTMKTHYYKEYYTDEYSMQYPTVWILVCVDNNTENIIQVGRTIDIVSTMDEIRENVKKIYGKVVLKTEKDKKYGELRNKNYKELVFYEVNIDDYIKKEEIFTDRYKFETLPGDIDMKLYLAYYFLSAAYVEGKIGFVSRKNKESMYCPSSLDGYFYSYYEKKEKKDTSD